MKAAVLTNIKEFQIREIPEPQIVNDTDVLLKVEMVGVCGSDIHYYLEGKIGDQVVENDFIPGHEFSATVKEVGPAVKRVKAGDRVAIDPNMPCGTCDQCLCGREHTCRNITFFGCPGQAEGCLTEYTIVPESSCLPISPETTFEQAVISEPLSIGLYAVNLSQVPMKGANIGILGAGPIGLTVLLSALSQGASQIFITDKLDYRLDAARKAGATWTGNPDKVDVVKAITNKEPLLLDAVFECCGEQDAVTQAMHILKPGGKLMIIGIPEKEIYSFHAHNMRRNEICIQNVRRQNGCAEAAVELLGTGKVDADFMITHRFTLEQTQDAFDIVSRYADDVIKAVIEL